MSKDKTKPAHKHLHARISYLQRAATYLTAQTPLHQAQPARDSHDGNLDPGLATSEVRTENQALDTRLKHKNAITARQEQSAVAMKQLRDLPFVLPPPGGLPLLLSNHMSQVARKSQIRLTPDTKHQVCERCNTILLEGTTSTKTTENLSKRGKKPHADVLVIECGSCGARKRFPIGAKRQRRKTDRAQSGEQPATNCSGMRHEANT